MPLLSAIGSVKTLVAFLAMFDDTRSPTMVTAADAFRLASQFQQTGQLASAEQLYRYVLELEPTNAAALCALGGLAFQACNWEQAIASFQGATRAEPRCAEYWYDLGIAYGRISSLGDAVAAFEQALLLQPHFAQAARAVGLLYREMGEIERAVACYQRALRLQPDYADAHTNLAGVLIEQGLVEQALAHYREALRIQPIHVHAYYDLSQLAAQGKYTFSPADLQQLRVLVGKENQPVLHRSVAAFALGNILDAQGAYDEAFACFQQANALRRAYQHANKRGFDAVQHRALVDEVIATFDRPYFESVRGWGTDSELPIFILGMPRSGTSLVEQILASHPQVYGAGELLAIPRLIDQLRGDGNTKPRPTAFAHREIAQQLSARFLLRLTQLAARKKATLVTDKNLNNALYLGLIATLFPHALLVHCRRDPRDVCLSCYFQNFHYMHFSWSLEEIAFYYGQYERLMTHWHKVLPLPIHDVCYEELIANQEHVTRRLLAHCGLSWDERCLAFYNTRRAVQTASTIQVRKPLSAKSIGRWKHYQSHLGPLLEALNIPPDQSAEEYSPIHCVPPPASI